VLDKQRIFAHRGLWGSGQPGNSEEALEKAISLGFSVETDIRDHLGKVVISHDPVTESSKAVPLARLLELSNNSSSYLALNVKADGLIAILPHANPRQFFFDMSSPEAMRYAKSDHSIALRRSDLEFELVPSGIQAEWLWLDAFIDDWFLNIELSDFQNYKGVVLVSPELHRRPKELVWDFAVSRWRQHPNLCICTDFPEEFLLRLGQ
jgi:hypothetical protein